MKAYYGIVRHGVLRELDNTKNTLATGAILLTKIECFVLHNEIKERHEGVHELLTWDTGLAFNCEFYSHEDLYNNLFKLKYDGIQLGQEG